MKLLNKILFATDFSTSSGSAFKTVTAVAKTFGSRVHLLNVLPELRIPDLHEEMIMSAAEAELNKVSDRFKEEKVEIGSMKIRKGVPFIQIMDEANLYDVNVIIIGSGGEQDTDMLGLGLTAEKVMQKSKKPVWVVHPDAKGEFRKIVCAVDFSSPSERALNNAIHLSRRFGAHLDVITVVPELTGFYSRILGNRHEKLEKIRTQHTQKFAEFIRKFDLHNVDWDSRVLEGTPETEVIRFTQGQNPDLLLMGTVGQDDSFRMQMGSVTKRVSREFPASMITFRSENLIQLHFDQQISDMMEHYEMGRELMNNGFPEEALNQYRICIEQDLLYAPAYEAAAEALTRLGREKEAEAMNTKANEIRAKLWQRNVELEIRGKHEMYKKKK